MSGSQSSSARPEEHTQLFTALAGRLLEGEGTDLPARRAHLLRLFSRLMPEAAPDSRCSVIEKLAAMTDMPIDLALVMARDRPDLSAPLLKYAPFTHDELVGLIARTGAEHHAEIAKRADLTLEVWLSMARAAARRMGPHATSPSGSETAEQPAAPKSAETKTRAQPETESEEATDKPDRSRAMHMMEEDDLRERLSALRDAAAQAAAAPPMGSVATDETRKTEKAQDERPADRSAGRIVPKAAPVLPLDDSGDSAWRFETDRDGRIVRLSSNAALAFGDLASSLVGQHLAVALQDFAASPAPDDIGGDMKRRAPIRDARAELQPPGAAPRRWRIRANPRFTFPDGRFEGYSGIAHDGDIPDRPRDTTGAPQTAEEILRRLVSAADRLAEAADTPELRDYAVTMRDYVESLQLMTQTTKHGTLLSMPDPPSA